MALRNQPYIPLYIQDFLTDEKLMLCNAESHGVYIRLMCIMHKSDEYGTISLLQQNIKQNSSTLSNFARHLTKFMPFEYDIILRSLEELVFYDVIQLTGEKLSQRRMIRDNKLSLARADAGKKGGEKTALLRQNTQQIE